ncbi:MAG: hypothetical protein JO244_07450 [Solirubrobacterales bacterium]|nr:hypothetical protein [Solirubrobacterales bacterium]
MRRAAHEPDWPALIADFQRCGLTHAAFCHARRLSLPTFRYHLYRLRHATRPTTPAPTAETTEATRFLPVHIRPEPLHNTHPGVTTHGPATLELVLRHDRRVRVPVGFDPDTLHQLLDLLEQRP